MSWCTIIIVNWNAWDEVSSCLEALVRQTFQDFKVVVVDNASEQGMPEITRAYGDNVTFIQNQNNLGFAAANNNAVRDFCDSEWVGLLNPDAFAESDWLEKLHVVATSHPEYSMLASRQLQYGCAELLDGDGDVYHITGLVWRDGYGARMEGVSCQIREVFSPCGASAFYRRDAFIAAGGMDSDFFCYVEDVDLGFRLRLLGHRCLLVPNAVVHHMGSATSGGRHSDFAIYHGHRNVVWAFVKNMPRSLFWLCLPLHIGMNVVVVMGFVLKGKGTVILRAKYDSLLGLPRMWRKRAMIQRSRRVSDWDLWKMLDKRLMQRRRPIRRRVWVGRDSEQ